MRAARCNCERYVATKYSHAASFPVLQAHASARSATCSDSRYFSTPDELGEDFGFTDENRRATLRSSAIWSCSAVRFKSEGAAASNKSRSAMEIETNCGGLGGMGACELPVMIPELRAGRALWPVLII